MNTLTLTPAERLQLQADAIVDDLVDGTYDDVTEWLNSNALDIYVTIDGVPVVVVTYGGPTSVVEFHPHPLGATAVVRVSATDSGEYVTEARGDMVEVIAFGLAHDLCNGNNPCGGCGTPPVYADAMAAAVCDCDG